MGLLGVAAFRVARDGAPASTATTASTDTSSSTSDLAGLADAIAGSLEHDLEVPLRPEEARCIADQLLATVSIEQLQELASLADPLASLDAGAHEALVRGVVGCAPPETAAALLGGTTTSTVPVELPGEGG